MEEVVVGDLQEESLVKEEDMEEEGAVEVLWENLEEVLVGDLVVEDGDLIAFTFLNKCLVSSAVKVSPGTWRSCPGPTPRT